VRAHGKESFTCRGTIPPAPSKVERLLGRWRKGSGDNIIAVYLQTSVGGHNPGRYIPITLSRCDARRLLPTLEAKPNNPVPSGANVVHSDVATGSGFKEIVPDPEALNVSVPGYAWLLATMPTPKFRIGEERLQEDVSLV